jgi:dolichol-phosphate mannosyltransferase
VNPSLSIFIPVYNEERTISNVITSLLEYFAREGIDYEILLLDDASQDGSSRIMERFAQENPARIKHFRFPNRQGLGRLMKTGYKLASKEWVMMISGDGQFLPQHFSLYLAEAQKADIVAGNRSARYQEYSFSRKLVSWVFNLLSKKVFQVPINDIGWSKLVRRRVLEKIRLKTTGAIVELELVVKALAKGFRICEVEVPFLPRRFGSSKSFNLKLLLLSGISLILLLFEMFLLRYFRLSSGPKLN